MIPRDSSPEHVLKTLDRFSREYNLRDGDQLWLCVDRDHQSWTPRTMATVAKECQRKTYHLGRQQSLFRDLAPLAFRRCSEQRRRSSPRIGREQGWPPQIRSGQTLHRKTRLHRSLPAPYRARHRSSRGAGHPTASTMAIAARNASPSIGEATSSRVVTRLSRTTVTAGAAAVFIDWTRIVGSGYDRIHGSKDNPCT